MVRPLAVLVILLPVGLSSGLAPDPFAEWAAIGMLADIQTSDEGGHRWITVSHHLQNTTFDTARRDIANTTFGHPSPGLFTLVLTVDPRPTIVSSAYYDENGTLIYERFHEFDAMAPQFESRGWFTVAERWAGGTLMTPHGDISFEGHWQDDGLVLNVTAIEPRMWRLGTGDYNED